MFLYLKKHGNVLQNQWWRTHNPQHNKKTIIYDCNVTWTHNHLVCKNKLNHLAKLASLAKWLRVCLQTKWLRVQVPLQSLKLQILCLFWAKSSLTLDYRVWIHSEKGTWHDNNIQPLYILPLSDTNKCPPYNPTTLLLVQYTHSSVLP